jgi:alanine racemase
LIHLSDLVAATGGSTYGPIAATQFREFCYDSRLVEPGDLFLAVVTDKGDGHDYIAEAVRGGATGVMCQRPLEPYARAVTCLLVDDTRAALLAWARTILAKLGPEVVGVTGSVGKTTTKELIAHVLSRRFPVFRNRASYNDRYGLPIALGQLEPAHRIAVLELASDAFDEIRELAELTRPRVGVVTAVGRAHLSVFGSLEAIAREKARLVEALPPNGVAVLNYDDPYVRPMAAQTRARVVTYGLHPDADLVAGAVTADLSGTSTTLFVKNYFPGRGHRGSRIKVRLRLLGRHSLYPALAAAAVGLGYELPLPAIAEALAGFEPLPGRLCPLPGLHGSLILDDSYNASPESVLAALDVLEGCGEAGRRFAVLGDLTELGDAEEAVWEELGQRVAGGADYLVTQGEAAARMAQALPAERRFVTFAAGEAVRHLRAQLAPGDAVLVKGAVEARMEQVVAGLLADPESASQVLVRQEPAWQKVRLQQPGRPTWVEIDLVAITYNLRQVVERVAPARVLAVLKADGYGHGAVKVGRTVLNNGATMLGVASLNEALPLRTAGIAAPILILGYTPPWQARELVRHDVTATVFDLDVAQALSRAAGELNSRVCVHVKVDSGMGRLGLLPDQVLPFVLAVRELPHLDLEGLFTHFSVADSDLAYTRWQVDRFQAVVDALNEAGVSVPLVHAANSAAIFTLPEAHFNLVRLGIALYGLDPSSTVGCPDGFRPALSFKTQVAQVKTLPPGSFVSYGNTYQTQGAERIAVIPVGYADGFRRAPRHWGSVLVRGQRAAIVGRVCMDQTMLDVSHIPGVRRGDEVVLIGRQGTDEITAEEVAERLGTITYEVVSEILARVPRVS